MLALVAGTGALPGALLARLRARGEVPVICALRGFAPDLPAALAEGVPRIDFRIETLGGLLTTLRAMGVDRLCMAGAVRRPDIDAAAVDAATAPLLPRLRDAMVQGDDGTLRALVAIIEVAGLAVIGAADIAPDLLPEAGCPTRVRPGPEVAAAAVLGEAALAEMGRDDTGQACVIAQGRVIAREGPAGTDAMLAGLAQPRRGQDGQSGRGQGDGLLWPLDAVGDMVGDLIGDAADWLSNAPPDLPAAGGILFKGPKPGQDRRVDLPVIGPDTVAAVARAGLAGIVIAAGGVIVLDHDAVVAALDRAGLFLWVQEAGV